MDLENVRVLDALPEQAEAPPGADACPRDLGPEADLPRDRHIALHARELTFLHPIRYEPVTVAAPLPAAWDRWGAGDLPRVE